jgi:transposase
MPGKPTKLTEETTRKVAEALRAGNTRGASCRYAGISEDSFARYLKNAEFAEAIQKAEADAEVRNVAIIQKAASDTWQAAAWWLERRRHQDWARKEKLEHSGTDGKDIKIIVEYAGGKSPAAPAPPEPGEGAE